MSKENNAHRKPDIRKVRREIVIQTEHQIYLNSQTPQVLSPLMTAQETFDTLDKTPNFQEFVRNITQLSYCPPEEWRLFHITVKGRANEMYAEDLLKNVTQNQGVLLDSAHARPIVEQLYPHVEITDYGVDYGFESSSLKRGGQNLPSPDFILIAKNDFSFWGEASFSHNENYWGRKKNKFQATYHQFKKKKEFKELFRNTNLRAIMTGTAYARRNRLLKRTCPLSFTPLPYSREEFDEYFDGILSPEVPTTSIYTDRDKLHWTAHTPPTADTDELLIYA